jgi:Tfp pilus assembly protein PilN
MADIDMIPRSYRDALRARRLLARYGAALALLAAAGVGAATLLRWRVAAEAPRLERLRAAGAQADALRARMVQAQQRRDALDQDAKALAALRGVGSAGTLAAALDAALNDKVWIERLVFSRTQELLREPVPGPAPPGTLLARTPGPLGAAQAWRLAGHVEIAAQAEDHAAMTAFLAALAASPALADVRFLNSKAAADGTPALSFSAVGALRPSEEAR